MGFEFPNYPYQRLRVIRKEVETFWKQWAQLAGKELFVREKWHAATRNVTVGDVVWVADSNAVRGQFRLGRVVEVYPDSRGIVRDVKIRTCPGQPTQGTGRKRRRGMDQPITPAFLLRDVRRVVVLVPQEEQ